MKRALTLIFVVGLLAMSSNSVDVLARQDDDHMSYAPSISASTLRGIGFNLSFPLATLPAPASTSTIFFETLFQGPLSGDVFYRTDLRFFFDFLTGFRLDLTSVRQSFLVKFTGPPVVFAVGGGLGVYPIQGIPAGTADGFLYALHARTLLEIQIGWFGIALGIVYEPMPQPFADIVAAGSLVTSSFEFSIGAIFHF